MRKAMILAVGTGSTVAHGIARAIQDQSPECVLFVGTEESLEKTLPAVLENTALEEATYEIRTTQDPNDVERISLECVEHIKWLMQKGYRPQEIVADFTSGTKAMSAGLVVAALSMEIARVSYVHGERDENGRVISGTERVTALEPNRLLVERGMDRAIRLFNRYQFDGCLAMLSDVEGRIGVPEVVQQLTLLGRLAKAYSAWDRFDLKAAISHFSALERHPLLPTWGLKKRVAHGNVFLHKEKESDYNIYRAVDLLENARRRAEEGKFDDAVARLYRLMEYVAQVKLHNDHGGLLTSDLNTDQLPAHLRSKYEPLKGPTGKVMLGLMKTYELLCDLGDPIGRRCVDDFNQKEGEVKNILGARNASILAHGFGPVGQEAYSRCLNMVECFMALAFEGWDRWVEMARFPKIRR